jgi:hypothetical protein
MGEETTLPRPFGDYLLVAQLGDDPLGSVYRALHSADEKRFVRLRILRSGELSPRLVHAAVARLEAIGAALAHDGIVRRPQFGEIGGVPYMAWYETAGWTLDRVLAMARAAKAPVTTEYALLLGERMIAATDAATQFLDPELAPHGVLWPGFVSISNDAEVRIAGFGLASAVLPALRKPRVSREIAPYVAPEARERHPAPNSDVYSLGIMLLELLTGRRPALGAPLPELRVGDPFAREITAFLKIALAPPAERFATAAEMRLALQETMRAAPKLLYPAGLAFYLYKLLNPESTGVPPADADATNPVETEPRLASLADPEAPASAPPQSEADADSLLPLLSGVGAEGPFDLADLAPHEIDAVLGDADAAQEESASGAAAAPNGADPLPTEEQPAEPPNGDPAAEGTLFATEDPVAAPVLDPELLETARVRPPRRRGGTAALLVLAATVFGLALVIDGARARRLAAQPPPAKVARAAAAAADRPAPTVPLAETVAVVLAAPAPAAEPPAAGGSITLGPDRTVHLAPARAARPPREGDAARRMAEDYRFQAGLARVAAERMESPAIAPARFAEGGEREREAERLYRSGNFPAARDAYGEAVRLYREAESVSHEERARRLKLSATP